MINLRDYKVYVPYIIICAFFLVTLLASTITYLHYNRELTNAEKKSDAVSLEIKLPVIQWAKYEGLSKKYADDKLQK